MNATSGQADGAAGAGIGGGGSNNGGRITISGGLVTARSTWEGAGIGGGSYGTGGTIVISGGDITASSKYRGAGIGGGDMRDGGSITIQNGTINAYSEYGGTGIGGGYLASGGTIRIQGGNITAKGGLWGAGIGSGGGYNAGDITVSGGTVNAIGGEYAAGIGAGGTNSPNSHNGGTIKVLGGKVTAKGGGSGMDAALDIGRGRNGVNGTLLIDTMAQVTLSANGIDSSATTLGTCIIQGAGAGSLTGAYIEGSKIDGTLIDAGNSALSSGAGYTVSGNTITLTGNGDSYVLFGSTTSRNIVVSPGKSVNVALFATDLAPVSGCAFNMTGATVNMRLISANTLSSGNGFAGLQAGAGSVLTVNGSGSLTAKGGSNGAGIGGGNNGSAGTINIKGGTINAHGKDAGAGIGGGYAGSGGMIAIKGGTVKASGGSKGAGIGHGFEGKGGTIALSGGVIYAQKGFSADYDIGINNSSFHISGDAAVFLSADLPIAPTTTSHTYEKITSMKNNKVYGVSTNGWSPPFYVYMVPYTLSYSLNDGTGIVPDSVTQHINTVASIESGEGLKRKGGAFICWNTAADGSATNYSAGEQFTFKENTTLYAQYPVMVDEITVSSTSNEVVRTKKLQMSAEVLPADATDKSYTWMVENGTGKAVIDENGLLTGTAVGTVTVRATANDGSGISGTKEITVTPLLVSGITVTSDRDTVMRTQQLQMNATVFPANADDKSFTWSVENGTGKAEINSSGLLTGIAAGTVTVKAMAKDGSGVFGTKELMVTPLMVNISVNGTYDISHFGNDSIININEGLKVSLKDTGDATYSNVQINCEPRVTLMIYSIKVDDSSYEVCPLSFTGNENKLILDGESDLRAGLGQPGVKVESGTSLEISGSGVLEAHGGFKSAGIGGGNNGGFGAVTLSGGVIYAERGHEAPYDIGNGYSGSAGTLSITGDAAVFLKTDTCITPATSHIHETLSSVSDNKVYGVSTNGWAVPFGVYMVPYTLSYSLNGGTGEVPGSVTQHINTTTIVSKGSGISREHHTFSGWNTAADGSGTGYNEGDIFTLADNTTLYAKWVPNKYTVSFDTCGGSEVGSISAVYGSTITAPDDPERTGYTFVGWFRDPQFLSAWDFDSDTVLGDITLYAKWTINKYEVSFNSHGGSEVESIYADYGNTINAPVAPERTGYTFGGWYREPQCLSAWDFSSDTITDNITLFAKWTINRYTLSYHAGANGTLKGILSQTVTFGGNGTKVIAVPKKHYHFVKWSDGVTTASRTDMNVSRDINVTAQFAKNSYKVVFVGHDGTVLKKEYVPFGRNATPPANPERAGYEFAGWNKGFTNIAADVTVTAQYKANTHEVTFKNYKRKIMDVQDVEYGKDAEATTTSERKGHKLYGNDTNVDLNTTDTAKDAVVPEIAHVETKGDSVKITLNLKDLDVTGASVEGGEATVNKDGTVTLEFPDGIKRGDVIVTFTLAAGSTKAITITEEEIAAAGGFEETTANKDLPIWIIGLGCIALIALAVLPIAIRRRISKG